MNLSQIQQKAVEHIESPLIVSAGAGSGKTRVLTHKFVYLVNNLGYNPNNILCCTFTNKASKELINRVCKLTGLDPDSFPWVRTIHSMCLWMLKPFLNLIDFNRKYTIFSSSDRKKLLKEILKDYKIKDNKLFWSISSAISQAKNTPDPINELENNIHIEGVDNLIDIFNSYMFKLKENNSFDFDDLLWYTYYLLDNNDQFRIFYQNLFKYILVDEYQDVNYVQNEIFKILANNQPKITVVGDDAQAIYSFRLANPEHFINFNKHYTNSKSILLEQNYRSTKPIVDVSHKLIKNNKNQIHKKCFSEIDHERKPILVKFIDNYHEALNIAIACKQYVKEKNIKYSDIAILYRVKHMSREIENQLFKNSIPYQIIGNVEFFERREIKDVMSYLYFINNYYDQLAFERLSQAPRRGLGKKNIDNIINTPGDDIMDKAIYCIKMGTLSTRATKALGNIVSFMGDNKKLNAVDVIYNVLQDFDFKNYLQKISTTEEEYSDRINNINELMAHAYKFKTMESFLDEMALMNNRKDEETNDKVSLMTIHASKGLEFKAVFVIGLEYGNLPHGMAIKEDKEEGTKKHFEEERRLFYVAITRSENVLNISFCDNRGRNQLFPSPFIKEIKKDCKILDLTKEIT